MDRAIFRLGLGIHATSCYLLLCSLIDDGQEPSLEMVLNRWTGALDELDQGLAELEDHRVVVSHRRGSTTVYEPQPSEIWK